MEEGELSASLKISGVKMRLPLREENNIQYSLAFPDGGFGVNFVGHDLPQDKLIDLNIEISSLTMGIEIEGIEPVLISHNIRLPSLKSSMIFHEHSSVKALTLKLENVETKEQDTIHEHGVHIPSSLEVVVSVDKGQSSGSNAIKLSIAGLGVAVSLSPYQWTFNPNTVQENSLDAVAACVLLAKTHILPNLPKVRDSLEKGLPAIVGLVVHWILGSGIIPPPLVGSGHELICNTLGNVLWPAMS